MSTPLAAWFDQTLLIRGKDAEIARLTECLRVAGLQCFMSTGKPEEVANHMASIAKANTDTIARLTAEVERLRGSKERLGAEVNAWRTAWRRTDIIMHPDGRKAIDSTIGTSLNRINGTQLAVDAHNDLAPAAGEAQEKTDG